MSNTPTFYHAKIADDVVIGNHVSIVQPVNLYGCTIGNHCFVGPFVEIQKNDTINDAVINYKDYIAAQTLADTISLVDSLDESETIPVEIEAGVEIYIAVKKQVL